LPLPKKDKPAAAREAGQDKERQPSGEGLGTVQRVIEILRYFADRGESSLKDLSVAVALAPSTCHRLLDILTSDGMIEHAASRHSYRVGPEFFRIAALIQAKYNIRTIAEPFLRAAVEACDETCVLSLYLPSEGKMFYAEKVDSQRLLRYQLPMNVSLSLLWGASGRSMLAWLSKADLDRVYDAEGRAPASGEALPSRKMLDQMLAAIRDRGYVVSYGQKIEGAVGFGAAVFGADGKVVGSLCITAPSSGVMRRDETRIGKLVQGQAEKLSAALGAPKVR
jgi:DNA-binding IclR family transcriptional regulator